MEEIKFTTGLKVYESAEALSAEDQALLAEAIKQLSFAYAPYSNFFVGSAVRTKSGKIFGGSNQENASYPLCMCAERVALYHAAAIVPTDPIVALAVVARNPKMKMDRPVMPCGACRQVIIEYANRHETAIKLLFGDDCGKVYEMEKSHDLLPFIFDKSFLM